MNFTKYYRQLHLWYFRYKDTVYFHTGLSGICLLISVLLIIYMIIPQIQNVFSLQQEVDRTKERISTINGNIAFLQALDSDTLDHDFHIASTALPPDRDVSNLVSAINASAINAGVILDDFSFQVGELTSAPVTSTPSDTVAPAVGQRITFGARGNISQIVTLVSELHKKIPILSISNVEAEFTSGDLTQISLLYFAQNFPLVQQDEAVPMSDISPQNKAQIRQLEEWEVPNLDFSDQSSSFSSTLSPL